MPKALPAISATPPITTPSLVSALVDWIEIDPFQAFYRKRKINSHVTGWVNRLASYFWPNPTISVATTHIHLAPMIMVAKRLRLALVGPWSVTDQAAAFKLAQEIFCWGNVPQPGATSTMVRKVFESVVAGTRIGSAPMNSGWTKVASFASVGLVSEQVIWDSRVAHALIRRLDSLLVAAGCTHVPCLQTIQDIGRVPGRGGNRTSFKYSLKWPIGYKSWPAQFAGSELVRLIRDELNNKKRSIQIEPPNPGGAWTVRDVEMVLFMDGY